MPLKEIRETGVRADSMCMAGASRLVLIIVCDILFVFKEMARKAKQLACGFILLIGWTKIQTNSVWFWNLFQGSGGKSFA